MLHSPLEALLQTSTVFTLVLTHSELQPWVRTALGREDPTPLAKLPLHEQRQVAMYAVAKLQVRAHTAVCCMVVLCSPARVLTSESRAGDGFAVCTRWVCQSTPSCRAGRRRLCASMGENAAGTIRLLRRVDANISPPAVVALLLLLLLMLLLWLLLLLLLLLCPVRSWNEASVSVVVMPSCVSTGVRRLRLASGCCVIIHTPAKKGSCKCPTSSCS